MADIFQNQEQIFQHVGKCIAAHRMHFSGIAVALKQPIAGVQHCQEVGETVIKSGRLT